MSSIPWTTVQPALRTFVVNASGLPDANVIWAQQGRGRLPDPWISLNITSVVPVGGTHAGSAPNPLTIAATVGGVNVSPANSLLIPQHGLSTGDGPATASSTIALPAGLLPATNYWVTVLDPNTIQLSASFLGAMASIQVPVVLADAGSGVISLASTSETTRQGKDIQRFSRGSRLATMSIQCFAPAQTGVVDAIAVVSDVLDKAKLHSQVAAFAQAGLGVSRTKLIKSTGAMVNMTQFEPRAIGEISFFVASEVSDFVGFIAEVRGTGPGGRPFNSGRRPNS